MPLSKRKESETVRIKRALRRKMARHDRWTTKPEIRLFLRDTKAGRDRNYFEFHSGQQVLIGTFFFKDMRLIAKKITEALDDWDKKTQSPNN